MVKAHNLEDLLADGFTERMAREYLEIQQTEKKSGLFDPDYLTWSHEHGFFAESAYAYGLTPENLDNYQSDYDDHRLWPLNSWQRIWINDKLTLYAMLLGTDLQKYLPEYYYYSTPTGLLPLAGSNGDPEVSGLLAKLREIGEMAAKPCNGELAAGFHKLAYSEGTYNLDGKDISAGELRAQIDGMKNYVFTEFIRPSAQFAAINPRIHTLRVLLSNETGTNPRLMANYLRFAIGGEEEGFKPNYEPPTTPDKYSYNAHVDLRTGHVSQGKIVYASKVLEAPTHPTSGEPVDMTIEGWPEIVDMIRRMALKFNACEYLGFDIGITDKGPRLMEINSHSGIKYVQVFQPLLADPDIAAYYREKLAKIDAMTPEQKAQRNKILR